MCFGESLLPFDLVPTLVVAEEVTLVDDVLAGATAEDVSAAGAAWVLLVPVSPPVAPVVAILASASASVSQVTLVPAEFTSGSATHCKPEAHEDKANFPPEHCANSPLTHAEVPSVHGDEFVNVSNCALSF